MDKSLGIINIKEIYSYYKKQMPEKVYKTADPKYPGVKRTLSYADKFIAGDIWGW